MRTYKGWAEWTEIGLALFLLPFGLTKAYSLLIKVETVGGACRLSLLPFFNFSNARLELLVELSLTGLLLLNSRSLINIG